MWQVGFHADQTRAMLERQDALQPWGSARCVLAEPVLAEPHLRLAHSRTPAPCGSCPLPLPHTRPIYGNRRDPLPHLAGASRWSTPLATCCQTSLFSRRGERRISAGTTRSSSRTGPPSAGKNLTWPDLAIPYLTLPTRLAPDPRVWSGHTCRTDGDFCLGWARAGGTTSCPA